MVLDGVATQTVQMQLLERETPLASLAEYAAEARRGDGRVVLVTGEAGVGKSALVEQLQRDLPDARWSWGSCDGLFTPRPLGPLFDLAAQLGGELLELSRAPATRDELFDALLRQLSAPELDVVVIEDVHWADEATVDLLRFLGRRMRHVAALVIVTFRDDSPTATDPLRLALGELATQRSTRRIGLAPLSQDAVRVLASGTAIEAAELHRLTGGNPFYVTEIVRAGTTAVPPSARDAVLARVARVSAEGRSVLEVAALTGARTELRLLESATACSPSVVDELLASGLLIGDGAWLRFRHEIARRAVDEAIAAHRRVPIHAQILSAMRSLGYDDDASMAFHAEASGNDAAVVTYAHRAARRASELASHREAAAQYERALRFVAGAEPAFVAGLYDSLANELSLVDRWHEAAVAGERALALWRAAGNRLREGDTLRRLSKTMWRLCRGVDSANAAEAAVTTLEPLGPTPELAWAYAALAGDRMARNVNDAAIELARCARAIAEPLGLSEVVSDALNTEGCVQSSTGGDWVGPLRRALDIAVSHGLEAQAGRAFCNLYETYTGLRRYAEGERYYVDGRAYCDEHDIATFGNCLRGTKSNAMEKLGQWDESRALATEVLDRVGSSPINRIQSLVSRGKIAARRGEADAWGDLDEAIASAIGTDEAQWIVLARLARVEAYWLQGELDPARNEAELAADGSEAYNFWDRGAVAVWLRRTGSTRLVQGELAKPYRLEVAGYWEKAAQRWTHLGCRYDAALALLGAADEAALRRAVSILAELGAMPAVRIAKQRMRTLGLRSIPNGARAATRAHPLGLTRREQEVLDLICGGHTNAEIAARLFISTKTVDHHVSAVLAKLGAPSRVAAASVAARLGLVGAAER